MHFTAFKRWVKTLCLFVLVIGMMSHYRAYFDSDAIQPGIVRSWTTIFVNNVMYLILISLGPLGIGYYWMTMCYSAIISGVAWLQMTPVFWMVHMIHLPFELYVFAYGAGGYKRWWWLILCLFGVALLEVEGVRWLRLHVIS